ncbi:hypothetical protein [Streptomyces cinereospinus]|uniref:Uncharacterized protein n=1 Tax=Streptomyces cinereospinus TaxID=285561 RepID=A0ABV5N4C9_9ACTN
MHRLLAVSHGWQTLLAGLVAGAAAVVVALLPDGGDGNSGRDEVSPTPAPTTRSASFVHIDSITHERSSTEVIVTLVGTYGAPDPRWIVYAFGQRQNTHGASATPASWEVRRARVDADTKTWSATFTVKETPATMRWSAALVHEGPGEPETACSTQNPDFACSAPSTLDRLKAEGPESTWAESPAPTRTTTLDAPQPPR